MWKIRLLASFFTIFTVLLSSCSQSDEDSVCAEGVVTDHSTGKPLKDVTVDILRDTEWGENSYYGSTLTDGSGSYSISDFNTAGHRSLSLRFIKDGYSDTIIDNVWDDPEFVPFDDCAQVSIKLKK